MSRSEIQVALGLKDLKHLRDAYLQPALAGGLIEMTLPSKPSSRLQRYRLTPLGRSWHCKVQIADVKQGVPRTFNP